MKVVALVALFIVYQIVPGLSKELRIPCYGEVFFDCKNFCKQNCFRTRDVCLGQCNRGCGCRNALIMLGNGGCMPLKLCTEYL